MIINIKNCYNSAEMNSKARKRPMCSMCGKCCKEGGSELTMTPSDYRRWKRQGRQDILRYARLSAQPDHGDLWIDSKTGEELFRCPFLKEISTGKYVCEIYNTRPKVCREFWCEWSFGVGEKGVPFKTGRGWEEKARQLGYDTPRSINTTKSSPSYQRNNKSTS